MDEKKTNFIKALAQSKGIISVACATVNISRSTYYTWVKEDIDFKNASDEVMEMQIDYVESKLLDNISNNDTTAIIFYLKTKGKNRGYSEKAVNNQKNEQSDKVLEDNQIFNKKIKKESTKIIKLLKKQEKYSPEMDIQIEMTAQLIVKTDILKTEIFSGDHKSILIEYSREGNEREIVSQKEKLYMDYVQQTQKALRALGMNADAKDRKVSDDNFNSFMDEFNQDK